MARKKKKSPSRRRRIGRAGKGVGEIGTLLGVGAGIIAGRFLASKLTAINPKLMGALQMAAGIGGAMFVKNPIVKSVAAGVFGAGLTLEAQSFGLITGVGDTPLVFTRALPGAPMGGYRSTPNISGNISGFDDIPNIGNVGRGRGTLDLAKMSAIM